MARRQVEFRPGGAHYTIWRIDGMDDVREVFIDRTDYTLNWLFVGTSGVHGDYGTLDDAEEALARPEDDDNHHAVTVLIVQPRLVRMCYGHVPVTAEDVAFLRDCVRKTLAGVLKSQAGSAAPDPDYVADRAAAEAGRWAEDPRD
jgi:hypothetical protein